MAINFIKTRGCVIQHNSDGGSGGYAIKGFPPGGPTNPIILTDAMPTKKDLVLPVTTLSNKKVLYSFGSDFGTIIMNGIIFLGAAGESTAGISPVMDWYETNSIGNKTSTTPIKISFHGKDAMSAFVVGIAFGKPSPENNFIPFSISAIEA